MSTLGTEAPRPKRVAIVQSNYIPWKGYFDLIHSVDEFILLDDVQYTRRDWRNRNRIKTPSGTQWLTIPVATKGRYLDPIRMIEVSDRGWARDHWAQLSTHYSAAAHFGTYRDALEDLYLGCEDTRLSAINRRFLERICRLLGITTRLSWSMDYDVVDGKTERLVSLCAQAGAAVYVSGPAARVYLDSQPFEQLGMRVEYMDYSGYPEYDQLYPPFDHFVTVLDLLLNAGPDAPRKMLTF